MFITILAKAKIGYTRLPIIIEIANMITFRETLAHGAAFVISLYYIF